VERKIFRPFRELNFVNMDGFPAMPHQNFLSSGFLFRRSDPHPNQQAVRFGKLL
jgi:hypothetical protein